MRTTLHGRIIAAHGLREALREQLAQGETSGPCRYKSITDCVDLVDELLNGRTAPDADAVVKMFNNTIERIHDAILSPNAEIRNREPHLALWDLLREVNKLTEPVKSQTV